MHIIRELGYSIKERPLNEAIILGRICKKEQWLTDAYVTLIAVKTPLDLVNLGRQGIDNDTIAKLFDAREVISSNTNTKIFQDKKREATEIVNQFPELVGMRPPVVGQMSFHHMNCIVTLPFFFEDSVSVFIFFLQKILGVPQEIANIVE
jgi:hypothetical protein